MNTLRCRTTPQDHAVTGGRDESFRYEGGHSPKYHTVALEITENLSDQTSQTAEHVVVNNLPVDRGHLPRTINHEVAQC